MNKIWSCPVRSLFASIMHLYKRELIINGLPLAFCSLLHSQKEFYILSSPDYLLLILKRKRVGGLNAEILSPLNSFQEVSKNCSLHLFCACGDAACFAQYECVSALICPAVDKQHSFSSKPMFRCICGRWVLLECRAVVVGKEKAAFGKGVDSSPPQQTGKVKSVLNYDFVVGGLCSESSSRKVILNSEKRRGGGSSMMFYFNNPLQACEPLSERGKKSFRNKARTIQPLKPNLQTSENMPSY